MTVVLGSKSYPQSWCHMPTLFWEISEISHILHLQWLLVTFSKVSPTVSCLTWSVVISVTQLSQSCHPEVDTSKVMKQNISMSFPAIQMHISNMTVVSGLKSYPQSWCHMPTLFSEISEISQVLYLWWLLVTQQGFTNFLCLTWSAVISVTQLWPSCHPEVDTSEVMKQNVSTNFPSLQMYNSNMTHTVVLGSKSYPQIWCHMPTLFSEINEISLFCTSDDFWWLLEGFYQLSLSDMISSHQCNSTITVMSSLSQYTKSYEAKCCYKLPSPTNAHFRHESCVGLEVPPAKLVSHAYLIFRNKWDISHFATLVTFGDFQQGFTNFLWLTWSAVISVTQLSQSCHPEANTSEVMEQNIAMIFPALQIHNSDMTVVLGSKSYPQSWCHMPTLFWQKKWDISHFAPAMTFGDFQQGFTNCLLSDMISGHQCNSTITVMSSWSRYIKSYEAKHFYELPSPINAHFQHDSCVRLQELPSKLVSHAYLIFRNKQDISRFAPLVTFGDSAGFHQFSMSDMISSHQCNSTMTVMSS